MISLFALGMGIGIGNIVYADSQKTQRVANAFEFGYGTVILLKLL